MDNFLRKPKAFLGGIKKIYLVPFVDYSYPLIKSVGNTLTVFPTMFVYQLDVIGNYTQKSTANDGGISWDQTITMKFNELYNDLDINIFFQRDFRVIIETNNGIILMLGVRNGLVCSLNNSSGTGKNEFNGFSLDFTGKEEKQALQIADLNALGIFIYSLNAFNYDLNFNF